MANTLWIFTVVLLVLAKLTIQSTDKYVKCMKPIMKELRLLEKVPVLADINHDTSIELHELEHFLTSLLNRKDIKPLLYDQPTMFVNKIKRKVMEVKNTYQIPMNYEEFKIFIKQKNEELQFELDIIKRNLEEHYKSIEIRDKRRQEIIELEEKEAMERRKKEKEEEERRFNEEVEGKKRKKEKKKQKREVKHDL